MGKLASSHQERYYHHEVDIRMELRGSKLVLIIGRFTVKTYSASRIAFRMRLTMAREESHQMSDLGPCWWEACHKC